MNIITCYKRFSNLFVTVTFGCLSFIFVGCEESEPYADRFVPVELIVEGLKVDGPVDGFTLKTTIGPDGGDFSLTGIPGKMGDKAYISELTTPDSSITSIREPYLWGRVWKAELKCGSFYCDTVFKDCYRFGGHIDKLDGQDKRKIWIYLGEALIGRHVIITQTTE